MGRSKMEKEFSEKLGAREMQPSAAAWDRLDAMLSTAEAQQKPKRNYWLLVAAAIVGVALFSSVFLINTDGNQTPDATSTGIADKDKKKQPATIDSVEAPKVQLADATEVVETTQTAEPTQQHRVKTQRKMKPLLASVAVKEESVNQKTVASEQKDQQTDEDDRIPESLLAAIRNKTASQKTSVVKVDAKSLLNGVDEKPESTSTNKFLRTVGRGYQTVKVAVANRNLEENH